MLIDEQNRRQFCAAFLFFGGNTEGLSEQISFPFHVIPRANARVYPHDIAIKTGDSLAAKRLGMTPSLCHTEGVSPSVSPWHTRKTRGFTRRKRLGMTPSLCHTEGVSPSVSPWHTRKTGGFTRRKAARNDR